MDNRNREGSENRILGEKETVGMIKVTDKARMGKAFVFVKENNAIEDKQHSAGGQNKTCLSYKAPPKEEYRCNSASSFDTF